jgi:hypothetical protein
VNLPTNTTNERECKFYTNSVGPHVSPMAVDWNGPLSDCSIDLD